MLEISSTIFILKEAGNNINLIECWFKDNDIQPPYLQMAGFSLVTASRPERSAGGVTIYIRNNLEFAEKYKWSDNNDSIIARD
jgi:hypothetical protein